MTKKMATTCKVLNNILRDVQKYDQLKKRYDECYQKLINSVVTYSEQIDFKNPEVLLPFRVLEEQLSLDGIVE